MKENLRNHRRASIPLRSQTSRFQLRVQKLDVFPLLCHTEFGLSGSTLEPDTFPSCALKRARSVRQAGALTHTNWVSQGIFSSLLSPSALILFTHECFQLPSIPRWVSPPFHRSLLQLRPPSRLPFCLSGVLHVSVRPYLQLFLSYVLREQQQPTVKTAAPVWKD